MDDSPPPTPPPGKAWRVAVVDDHSIIRSIFKTLVEDDPGLEFIWGAATLAEARTNLGRAAPDLLIVDISLPDGEGFELISETLAWLPTLQILVVSSHEDTDYVQRARDCGSKGYLSKNSAPGDILEAISLIKKGGTCFDTLPRHARQGRKSPHTGM